MEELNSGPLKTNPSSGREEDLNPGPPDYKSSALPLGHARLPLDDVTGAFFKISLLVHFWPIRKEVVQCTIIAFNSYLFGRK